jgi:haloalkane dehalogenase
MSDSPAAVRAPDERFAGLPDFPWEPSYREWEGLRLAHLDVGPADGPVVVLWHGEPTWSYLWRHVIPPLVAAGCRCIAPDLPGFGRSDKPTDFGWYTYDRHAMSAAALVADLGLKDATYVVHDWGGPVGLRAAMEHPQHVGRLVILDTGLFTGEQRMTDAWRAFRDFVERTEDLPISMLVGGACATPPTPEVLAAYDAPFPDAASKAGARAFPLMIPLTPDSPGAAEGRTAVLAVRDCGLPKLVLWADGDPILPLKVGKRFSAAINAPDPEVITGASHFLQEDQGAVIGERIVGWLTEQGVLS